MNSPTCSWAYERHAGLSSNASAAAGNDRNSSKRPKAKPSAARRKVGWLETYFEQFEQGWGSPGQTYVSLPEETRRAVREDVRRDVGDTGGPVEIEVEFMFASGRK